MNQTIQMNIDQIITITSSIATWITTLIILLTLFVMSKQRRESIKPEIIPKRQSVYGIVTNYNIIWLSAKPENENAITKLSIIRDNYKIHLFNIGIGAAKNIDIQWDYETQGLIDKINSLSQKNLSDRHIDFKKNEGILFNSKNGIQCFININNDLIVTTDYLLQASIEKDGFICRFPITYIMLTSMYVQEMTKNEKFCSLEEFPLFLQIMFYDIANKRIIKKYKIIIHICAILKGKKSSSISIDGYLEIKKN